MEHLTNRERMIATLIAQGALNQDIAEVMGVSETTIKNDLSTIYRVLRLGPGLNQRVMLANAVAAERDKVRDDEG